MKLKKIIKDCIPPILWRALKQLRTRLSNDNEINLYFCPVCNQKVNVFLKLPNYYDEMLEKYQYIHSSYCIETMNARAYLCPNCFASDRDRLYAIFLNQKFKVIEDKNKKYAFLEIAPAQSLSNFIRKHDFIQHRSADLYMEGVDDKVDITDMNIYRDNSFDMILCSHVLEHIENDGKAISELYRVLKPFGFGIIMVPIILSLEEDFENPEYKTEAERWKYFGQNDHVRAYSKTGFVNKLYEAGFKVQQLGIDYFGADIFEKNGIHPRSVLYVVEK
jgi:predicted SAM-dependent methyltransferase